MQAPVTPERLGQINREILSSEEVSERFADLWRLPLRTMAIRDLCVFAMRLNQEDAISVHDASTCQA